jgi:imidazolonepropionase-like amidohydrolase
MLAILLSALAAAPPNLPPLPADVPKSATLYSALAMGQPNGQQAVWSEADGTVRSFFQFNDRGRGPKTYASTVLRDGVPWSEQIDGNDYMKDAVKETFSREGTHARWKSKAEAGEKDVSGPAFYLPMYAQPVHTAWLVRAALARGGKIALLPVGEARVQKVLDEQVSLGGKTESVSLYIVYGLDFFPSYVWLDSRQDYFAHTEVWGSVIHEGAESAAPHLLEVKQVAEHARAKEQARRLAHVPKGKLLIHDVSLFDAPNAQLVPHQDVLILGNRILSVTPTAKAPAGAEVIEGKGKTLLPGLWDMHAHVADGDGLLNLATGVTSVRDLANDLDDLLARHKRIESGDEVGTRIVMAGIIDGPGPFQGPTKVLVANEKDGRAWVDKYASLGYAQIKLYSSLKPELVAPLAEEAHAKGLRVSGHVPSGMIATEAVRGGYDEIQHVNFLLLNFMPDVKETRTPARFTEPARRAADLDLSSAPVRDFVQLLKERHTALDPTLGVFESMMLDRPGALAVGMAPVAARLPPAVRRGLFGGNLPVPAGMDERYKASWAKTLQLIHLFWEAGIPIEVGTDWTAGFALHRELELDVQAGIPPPQALRMATWGAAQIMGLSKDLGALRPGKLADAVLVDGDPTAQISDVRKASVTIKDGVIYKAAELYQELGVSPQ